MSPADCSNVPKSGFRARQLFAPSLRSNPSKPQGDREQTEESPKRRQPSDKSAATEPLTEGETSPAMPSRERRNRFRFAREETPLKEHSGEEEGKQAKRRPSGAFRIIRNALFSHGKDSPQTAPEVPRCVRHDPHSNDDQFRSPFSPDGSPLKPPSRLNLHSPSPSPKAKTSSHRLAQKRFPRQTMVQKKLKDGALGHENSEDTGSETRDVTLSQKLIIGHRKGNNQRNGIDHTQSTEINEINTLSTVSQE